ncbi:FAD binding domain-containing protein [Macrophomina phaseolina]|uniref:FAD binding domain-containing protein n=1 Tax=Macrophomina phaseolina TaxID=35725 RepID=A0ABQ8GSD8_9PEZI|nr:FAD binding domain-containing protein [Macrophomina phaseolina]
MGSKNFKVIIAGGSIAGLTLANMLGRLGIDFVVLEAYPEIAPQVGASIGLSPNGLRILDQLGMYEAIRGLIQQAIQIGTARDANGKILSSYNRVADQLYNRHGYDVIFVDRQMVLQELYNHIKSKEKVLVNKRVVEVHMQSSGVTVTAKDGTTYEGDILVGADGVHSTVRREMWRIADQVSPGYIPASEHTAIPCDYMCMFGISVMKSFEARTTHNVFKKLNSILVIAGPNDRVYWFYFRKLDRTHYGTDMPRYTKKDEEEFAATHANEHVTEDTTFGDLYAARISSVLTPLPEYSFKKWHFGRIMTIGDAAHKFEPISAQGGNSAIETAAVLVNNLTRMMKSHPESLSDDHINTVFSETQKSREDRVWQLIRASHQHQVFEAMETPLLEFLARYYVPTLSPDQKFDTWATNIYGADRLEMLDVPKRFRFLPFRDELPSRPLGEFAAVKLVLAVAFGLIFQVAQKALQINPESWDDTFISEPLKQTYTGIAGIDPTLQLLVWAFSKGVTGPNPNFRLQCLYFMVMLLPMALIWTVEAYRNGNHKSLVSLPIAFGAVYQLIGIGKIAPLYYLVSIYTSGHVLYTRTTGRPIHSSVAKALLPALCIGYVIPTILMFLPHESATTQQIFTALWQPFPLYVAGLTFGIAALIRHISPSATLDLEMFEQKDIAPLQASYAFSFFTTAATHICSLIYIASNSSVSVSEVFFNLPQPGNVLSEVEKTVFNFFKYDMILCFSAVFIWYLYSIFELRRVGYVTTEKAIKAAIVTAAAQVVVGPGAAYTGVWAWREFVIASMVQQGK